MRVCVVDRRGRGYEGVKKVIVEIADTCPRCGGPRGQSYQYAFWENDEWHFVSRWDNPCGHQEKYADVIQEAEAVS